MKKILIVDDTPANLEAAKSYFSQSKDFEFVYATNRKDAEKLLPNCDGLITDGQMPFDEKSMSVYEGFDLKKSHIPVEQILAGNGNLLLIEAFIANKPSLLLSYHGDTLVWMNVSLQSKDLVEEKLKREMNFPNEGSNLDKFKNFIGKEFENPWLTDSVLEVADIISLERKSAKFRKDNSTAWEFGLKKISEEFKLGDIPNEIPSIGIPKIKLK